MCKVCNKLFRILGYLPNSPARIECGDINLAYYPNDELFYIECYDSYGWFEGKVIVDYCPFCGCNLDKKLNEILLEVQDD